MSNSVGPLSPAILSSQPIEVSNYEFLESIFCQASELTGTVCLPVCVSFGHSPATARPADWYGFAWDKVNEPKDVNCNSYFSISAFQSDEHGKYRRKKSQFAGQFAIVFDDVVAQTSDGKTKAQIPWSQIKLAPSWVLETSKGNFQVGYILVEPITDEQIADALSKAIISKGLSDPGAGGPSTRLMRLPYASNTKAEPPFRCQMKLWEPERRYSLQQFMDAYGISLSEAKKAKAPLPAKAKTVQIAYDGNAVWKAKPSVNIVVESLKSHGLIKSEIALGKYDITCPWTEEHTDQVDSGACYWEPDDEHPIGSFKCQHAHCQERNISDLLEFLGIDPEEAYMKDRIFVNPGEINRIVEAAERILARTGLFYQRAGRVVAVYQQLRSSVLKEVNIHDLSIEMARLSRWQRYDGRAKRCVPMDPSAKCLTALLESQNHKFLPEIEAIARQPILQEDGKIDLESGYHPKTRLYCSYDAEKYRFAEKPFLGDAEKALAELKKLLEEFQFEDSGDESAALCAMLTASVRTLLPLAPMFLIKAHQPGTGKGVLSELISLMATAEKPSPIAFPKDSTECEKLLLAELLKAPSVLFFDNLTCDLYPHKYLCSAITSETLTGRVLGESRTATVGTKALILANGNNVVPVGDMTRRTVPISIDAKEEIPASRTFKNPNLLQQVREHREYYVSCALRIISAWIHASKPYTDCPNLNSFEKWSEWCRQPLLWLGLPDPVKKVFMAMNDDPERVQVGRVFDGIRREFETVPFSVKDLSERAARSVDSELLREPLEDIGCFDGCIVNRNRLGWWLKKKVGWSVNGIRLNLVSIDAHTKQPKYQLSIRKHRE